MSDVVRFSHAQVDFLVAQLSGAPDYVVSIVEGLRPTRTRTDFETKCDALSVILRDGGYGAGSTLPGMLLVPSVLGMPALVNPATFSGAGLGLQLFAAFGLHARKVMRTEGGTVSFDIILSELTAEQKNKLSAAVAKAEASAAKRKATYEAEREAAGKPIRRRKATSPDVSDTSSDVSDDVDADASGVATE